MNFEYYIKLSVSLAVVYLFYRIVLRRLTFYNWNRCYLLLYTILSFFIPFIDISPVLQRNQWAESKLVQWVPQIEGTNNSDIVVNQTSSISPISVILWLVMIGMLLMVL